MMELRLTHLRRRFGRKLLFDDLNVSVRPGEWLAITGANGSGKTTLIRILAGLTRPTSGAAELWRDGQSLTGPERRAALGLVTPDLALDGDLTARENLEFHAQMRGLALGAEEALLAEVGLEGRGGDLTRTFSSGMRQRLKYAFALQRSPPLLLLDEPTANLDAEGEGMVTRMKARQRERGILVVATNNPREAEGATHTLRLSGGLRQEDALPPSGDVTPRSGDR